MDEKGFAEGIKSVRGKLAISYAALALLAAFVLGFVLLATLLGFYRQREYDYLTENARYIAGSLSDMLNEGDLDESLIARVENFSFLSQTRIRIFDAKGNIILDSGTPQSLTLQLGIEGRIRESGTGVDYRPILIIEQESASTQPAAPSANVLPTKEAASPKEDVSDLAVVVEMPLGEDGSKAAYAFEAIPASGSLYGFRLNPESGINEGKRSRQSVMVPIYAGAGETARYHLELSEGPAYGNEIVTDVLRAWGMASVVAVALAAIIGWFLSRRISAPVITLANLTSQMASGDLSVRSKIERRDEFGILARSFNTMAQRVEDTIAMLRQFVADAAHEIHTPLTALRINLDLKTEKWDTSSLSDALVQIKKLETLTRDLLDLSRIEANVASEEMDHVDLIRIIQEIIEPIASRAEQSGLNLSVKLPNAPVEVVGNASQLQRMLLNLLENAIKFTSAGDDIELRVYQNTDNVVIVVEDTGIGIPSGDLPFLFNRFYRGRNAESNVGSGLGLAIVRAVAKRHDGEVQVSNTEEGARFTVKLPKTPTPSSDRYRATRF